MRPEFYTPGVLNRKVIQDMLALVGCRVPAEAVARWTRFELMIAADWASREHFRASDSLVHRRDKPSFVAAAEGPVTLHLFHHRSDGSEMYALFRDRADAEKACGDDPRLGDAGPAFGSEVIGLTVLEPGSQKPE